jgi:hypothetical protein
MPCFQGSPDMACDLRWLRDETPLDSAQPRHRSALFRREEAFACPRSERQTCAEEPTPLQRRPQPTDTLKRSPVSPQFSGTTCRSERKPDLASCSMIDAGIGVFGGTATFLTAIKPIASASSSCGRPIRLLFCDSLMSGVHVWSSTDHALMAIVPDSGRPRDSMNELDRCLTMTDG